MPDTCQPERSEGSPTPGSCLKEGVPAQTRSTGAALLFRANPTLRSSVKLFTPAAGITGSA